MSVTITPPTERTCEDCGRTERWVADAEGWQIVDEPGNVFCIHEWDVNGTFVPFKQ
ncbi:HEWD family protein [Halorubrum sp. JWXQ-INN 858]|uniref:HEWD family protein n=1 Tax=Halorubrum sp. JWXQ-INN 858 TaxID=2690782 RepID=UPI00190F4ADC|nr:HEWD family protein [Halorubrum sp. JWXQ-INN 858]